MNTLELVKKVNTASEKVTLRNEPAVLLPVSMWEEIQETLEDFEAMSSDNYKKHMVKAREDIKKGDVVSFEEVVG